MCKIVLNVQNCAKFAKLRSSNSVKLYIMHVWICFITNESWFQAAANRICLRSNPSAMAKTGNSYQQWIWYFLTLSMFNLLTLSVFNLLTLSMIIAQASPFLFWAGCQSPCPPSHSPLRDIPVVQLSLLRWAPLLKILRNHLVGHFSFNFDISSARSWRLLWAQWHLPFGCRRGAKLSMSKKSPQHSKRHNPSGGQASSSVCRWLCVYKAGWTHWGWILLQVSLVVWLVV